MNCYQRILLLTIHLLAGKQIGLRYTVRPPLTRDSELDSILVQVSQQAILQTNNLPFDLTVMWQRARHLSTRKILLDRSQSHMPDATTTTQRSDSDYDSVGRIAGDPHVSAAARDRHSYVT